MEGYSKKQKIWQKDRIHLQHKLTYRKGIFLTEQLSFKVKKFKKDQA